MKVTYSGFTASKQSPAAELLAAMSAVTTTNRPHLLGYTPVARVNPFQSLLYKRFADNGIAVGPILQPDRFRALQDFQSMTSGTSLHLHWNAWMTFGSSDPVRARTMAMGMVGRLEALRARDVNLIWTVHNLYPHDAKFVDLELEVQQRIADLANVVHIMSRSTQDAMAGIVDLDPEKLLYSPHPNYRGAYPDHTTRQESRSILGIGPEEVVFLMFGAIKPYKGLSRLLEALDHVVSQNRDRQIRLLIAGAPDTSEEAQEFVSQALVHPNVLIERNRVPAERAQYFLRAADVGLVNYERLLNSGAALLYQTFGLPVVAADTSPLREGLLGEATVFVNGRSARDFASALEEAIDKLVSDSVRRAVLQHVAIFDPDIVSNEFALGLRDRLGT